jgi:hypothetical protein
MRRINFIKAKVFYIIFDGACFKLHEEMHFASRKLSEATCILAWSKFYLKIMGKNEASN